MSLVQVDKLEKYYSDSGILAVKDLPDEFVDETRKFKQELLDSYKNIYDDFINQIENEKNRLKEISRKDSALWAQANLEKRYLPLFFNWLSNKEDKCKIYIWGLIQEQLKEEAKLE